MPEASLCTVLPLSSRKSVVKADRSCIRCDGAAICSGRQRFQPVQTLEDLGEEVLEGVAAGQQHPTRRTVTVPPCRSGLDLPWLDTETGTFFRYSPIPRIRARRRVCCRCGQRAPGPIPSESPQRAHSGCSVQISVPITVSVRLLSRGNERRSAWGSAGGTTDRECGTT